MSSNIAKDLYEAYLNEMEPQLGKKKEGGSEGGGVSSPDEAAAKRIRQAVYDIRYRARREDIDVSQAYSQYMSNTSMAANEKSAVRDKLGLGTGGQAGGQAEEFEYVDEDAKPGERYLRVKPQRGTGEKEYVRKFDPKNPLHRQKAARLRAKGISATQTSHGDPYDMDHSKGAGEKYEKKYGPANGKNTKGDLDKDGTVEPDRHEYAGVKDKAIKKAMAKKGTKKESFSDWREEIREVVEKANAIKQKDDQIKEKAVHNTIKVNPDIPIKELADNLGAELVESVDLGEDFEEMVADYATEYFFAEGLNENGIDILIEDIGVDDFVDYVLDLFEEFEEEVLTEARRSGRIEPTTKTGKDVGSLKGGAKTAAIKRLRGEKAKRREAEASASAEKPSGLTAALKSQSEKAKVAKGLKKASTEKKVEKAKAAQAPAANKSSEGTKKEVKKGILGAIRDRAAKDTEQLKKSWQTAREVGKKHERNVARAAGTAAGVAVGAAKAVHRAGQEAGRSEAGKRVKATLSKAGKAAAAGAAAGAKKGETNTAAGRAGRAVGTFIKKMKEDYELWIDELIDEGYDVWEYDEFYLVETYLPEDLDEGLGTALRGMLTSRSQKERVAAAKERMAKHREAMAKGETSPYVAQRKKPSTPIKKPNTSARDPWSGNPETDKAWAKRSASTPHAYKGTHEEFEEWMEAILAEGLDIDENMLFLIYESSLAEEMMVISEKVEMDGVDDNGNTKCWKGYVKKGTKVKGGKEVNNCVKAEETKLDSIISRIRDTEEVDEGVASAARVAGKLAMRALTSKAAKKAAKKVGKSALAGATAGAAERAGEAAYDTTRNIGKKKETECEEFVSELNRYEKETGKDYRTGKKSTPGGTWKDDPVMKHMNKVMGSSRMGVQPRGKKKVPGQKPPAAGEYGGPMSPAQKVARRRANAQRAIDNMSSRFD